MEILVINSGSSSLKFKFHDIENKACIASGFVEEIGTGHSRAVLRSTNSQNIELDKKDIKNHDEAIDVMFELLKQGNVLHSLDEIDAIGHRIVQGADYFDKPVLIDESVMAKIEELSPIAPLHNPANLAGIKSCLAHSPNIPNVAVFDTIFHQSMPKYAYMYALPYEFYTKYKVRKYGAHGTSHWFVSQVASEYLQIPYERFNAITLHMGNGSSISAIKNGKCIDTSMGLTPLEGLMMGTRCGSIDPAIIPYIERVAGYDAQDMDEIMNKKSGLFGVCGTSDFRKILERKDSGDEMAKLAFDMLVYSTVKFIGSYYAVLGHIDAVVFTGGIGENAIELREEVCKKLAHFGISIDSEKNRNLEHCLREVNEPNAKIKTLVIPTNEELAIAQATAKLVSSMK